MVWVWVFLGIAVVGLVMVVCHAVWLAHLAADVLSELAVLGDQVGQLADLMGQVRLSGPLDPDRPSVSRRRVRETARSRE